MKFESYNETRKMCMLVGMGQELNGDDAVGCVIADNFSERDWLSVNAGAALENFIGLIKRERPSLLVLVDAAEMGLSPGEIRRIDKAKANSLFYSTHSLPVSQTVSQIEPYVEEIVIVGIQPNNGWHLNKLSPQATDAARRLICLLKEGRLKEIELL
ncbi:MAG: hydrogenase maturation protease [Candidatus Diapherotrites archaeon]